MGRRRIDVEKLPFYKPTVAAALNIAKEAMTNYFAHNDLSRADFIRRHKGYGFYNHATAAKHFDLDSFLALAYILGYRLNIRELDNGWVLMLDLAAAYNPKLTFSQAYKENEKTLRHCGIFPKPHTELSLIGQIYWSRQAYDIVRGPKVHDHQIILEFIRNESVR